MADWVGSYFVDLGTGRIEDGRVTKAPRGRLQRMDGLRGDIAPFNKTTADINVFYSYMKTGSMSEAVRISSQYRSIKDDSLVRSDMTRVISAFKSQFISAARRWRVVLQNEKRKVDSGEENNYKNLERSCQQELQGIVRSIASQAKAVISSFTPSPKNDILKWLQKVQ